MTSVGSEFLARKCDELHYIIQKFGPHTIMLKLQLSIGVYPDAQI